MKHAFLLLIFALAGTSAQTITPVLRGGSGTPALLDDVTRITFTGTGDTLLMERSDGADTIALDSILHVSFDEDGAVPVELASFTAVRTGDGMQLAWRTESEENNLGWYVLRGAAPDAAFERLTAQLIPGAGSSAQAHDYTFTDTDAGTGIRYYRLQQIDTDGAFWYSWIITVPATAGITDRTVPVPELRHNPARTFTFGITLTHADDMKLRINRSDGTHIATLYDGHLPAGRHRFTWPGTDAANRPVPQGTYLLRAETKNGGHTLTKLVVH